MSEERKIRATEVLKELQKKGVDNIMLMSGTSVHEVPTISSGISSLDLVLTGVIGKGYPHGRIIEIYGAEGGGKTTTTLHAIIAAQQNGGIAAFVDAEHALDVVYAKNIGVDIDNLLIQQPDSGENGLDTVIDLSSVMNAGDIIVVDSVAALIPQSELDGEISDQKVAEHARMMSKAMRKLAGAISKSGVILIFVNQERNQIMGAKTTTGGKALKFYATQRVEVKRVLKIKAKIDGEDQIVGNEVEYHVTKNKIFPPFRKRKTELRFGLGVPRSLDLIKLALGKDIVKKSGSWFSWRDEKIGQGMNNTWAYFNSNEECLSALEKEVIDAYGS